MEEKKEADRVILHCDCNSFFASVETVLNPSYAGVPMAVCGSQENRHGIVLAKNEEAKAYGIQTAETVYSAKNTLEEALSVYNEDYKRKYGGKEVLYNALIDYDYEKGK